MLERNTDRKVDVRPDEARRPIDSLKRRGVPDDVIVKTVRGLGPPTAWIMRQLRGEARGPIRVVSTPGQPSGKPGAPTTEVPPEPEAKGPMPGTA